MTTRVQTPLLLATVLLVAVVLPVRAQDSGRTYLPRVEAANATEALQLLLEANIEPGGPLRGDGAAIAGLLAAQGLTFPIASSSGAFVVRLLHRLGPDPLAVSASGSFGPLFAERGRTNGRGNLSVSFGHQRIGWATLGGSDLGGYKLVSRRLYRNDMPNGAAGTVDEFGADIKFTTDVFILAANYGLTDYLDFGVSVPALRLGVDGAKRLRRTQPQREPEDIDSQRVSGTSSGLGDVVVRMKANIYPLPDFRAARSGVSRRSSRTHVAFGADWRLATGDTAGLDFSCSRAPCTGTNRQAVASLGLGRHTVKLAGMASVEIGRLSPHLNFGRTWVPTYDCSRGGPQRLCKGAIFELDSLNNTQDAKDQRLSDEWNATIGADYQLLPYRATVSFDVIGRQLVRAGQFYENRSRLIYRTNEGPESSVVSEFESRHGNVTPVVGAAGAKVAIASRLVLAGHVMFPLNRQGLQPGLAWVVAIERAFGR